MSLDFASDWMLAKRLFETATGKKKPGKKFLGVFKMSSGVEDACKDMEKAIAQPSVDRLAKAEKAFDKAAESYLKVLQKAADDDGNTDRYKLELGRLETALEKIRLDFTEAKRNEVHDMPMAFGDIVPQNIVDGLLKSDFPTSPLVKAFVTKSEFVVSGVDNKTKLPAAVSAQKSAQVAIKNYAVAMKEMKTQTGKVMERKAAWEKAVDLFRSARLATTSEGLQVALAHWVHAQQDAFKDADKQTEFDNWLKTSPAGKVAIQVGKAITAEESRLNDLKDLCSKQAK